MTVPISKVVALNSLCSWAGPGYLGSGASILSGIDPDCCGLDCFHAHLEALFSLAQPFSAGFKVASSQGLHSGLSISTFTLLLFKILFALIFL